MKDQRDAVTDKPIVTLKPRVVEEVNVVMKGLEAEIYARMSEVVRSRVKTLLENDYEDLPLRRKKGKIGPGPSTAHSKTRSAFQSMNSVLVMLLRLRQAAVHMTLTAQDIDMEVSGNEGIHNADAAPKSLMDRTLHGELLDAMADSDAADSRIDQIKAVFQPDYISAKFRAVLEHLHGIVESNEKCVIVSQWATVLGILEGHLQLQGIRWTSITGKVPTKDRQERVNLFNRQGSGGQVMLLSLAAGGVGLNLTGANHLFLVDLHWNPALEHQAFDRIYRIGQTRDVFIRKFVCASSVEQQVLALQDKKKQLANEVLDGVARSSKPALDVNDRKFIFGLDMGTGKTARVKQQSASQAAPWRPYKRAVYLSDSSDEDY